MKNGSIQDCIEQVSTGKGENWAYGQGFWVKDQLKQEFLMIIWMDKRTVMS